MSQLDRKLRDLGDAVMWLSTVEADPELFGPDDRRNASRYVRMLKADVRKLEAAKKAASQLREKEESA